VGWGAGGRRGGGGGGGDLRGRFDVVDLRREGGIDEGELKHIMTSIGENVQDEDIDDMIKEADEDGDDAINFEEFYRKVTNPK